MKSQNGPKILKNCTKALKVKKMIFLVSQKKKDFFEINNLSNVSPKKKKKKKNLPNDNFSASSKNLTFVLLVISSCPLLLEIKMLWKKELQDCSWYVILWIFNEVSLVKFIIQFIFLVNAM